jgi:hypothetical protein
MVQVSLVLGVLPEGAFNGDVIACASYGECFAGPVRQTLSPCSQNCTSPSSDTECATRQPSAAKFTMRSAFKHVPRAHVNRKLLLGGRVMGGSTWRFRAARCSRACMASSVTTGRRRASKRSLILVGRVSQGAWALSSSNTPLHSPRFILTVSEARR